MLCGLRAASCRELSANPLRSCCRSAGKETTTAWRTRKRPLPDRRRYFSRKGSRDGEPVRRGASPEITVFLMGMCVTCLYRRYLYNIIVHNTNKREKEPERTVTAVFVRTKQMRKKPLGSRLIIHARAYCTYHYYYYYIRFGVYKITR